MTIKRDKNGDFLPGSFKDEMEYFLYGASQDTDLAESVLEYFCDVVGRGEVPDRRVLEFLANAFRQIIVDGASPSHALNLVRAKGKGRLRTLIKIHRRDLELAVAVAKFMRH